MTKQTKKIFDRNEEIYLQEKRELTNYEFYTSNFRSRYKMAGVIGVTVSLLLSKIFFHPEEIKLFIALALFIFFSGVGAMSGAMFADLDDENAFASQISGLNLWAFRKTDREWHTPHYAWVFAFRPLIIGAIGTLLTAASLGGEWDDYSIALSIAALAFVSVLALGIGIFVGVTYSIFEMKKTPKDIDDEDVYLHRQKTVEFKQNLIVIALTLVQLILFYGYAADFADYIIELVA